MSARQLKAIDNLTGQAVGRAVKGQSVRAARGRAGGTRHTAEDVGTVTSGASNGEHVLRREVDVAIGAVVVINPGAKHVFTAVGQPHIGTVEVHRPGAAGRLAQGGGGKDQQVLD